MAGIAHCWCRVKDDLALVRYAHQFTGHERSRGPQCPKVRWCHPRPCYTEDRSGAIAQLGERNNGIVEVGGSIPPGSTNSCHALIDLEILDVSRPERLGGGK